MPIPVFAATLEVGPGKQFSRIEEANAKAQAGDVILVYPRAGGQPYDKTAVFVRQKNLTFRAVAGADKDKPFVALSGQGFDYSGEGSTPRAIFQFNPGSDNCTLEGFELSGAHNSSHNGAGVRINQANHVAVRKCSIHDNDMGIMSNGDGSLATAVDQRIEECRIFRNGDPTEPGNNHNLYLGGTSVTLRFCEVHHSLTGHNVKSRAHHTRVEYCYVHHSANREFDLVDAAETARPQSDAVLLGNIIVKDPKCSGNRTVIHFGQDGGKPHNGTLYLAFNTIVTPFIAPVVELSTAGAKAELLGNVVASGARQAGQKVAARPRRCGDAEYRRRSELVLRRFLRPGDRTGRQEQPFRTGGRRSVLRPSRQQLSVAAQSRPEDDGSPSTAALLDLPAVPGLPDAAALRPLEWQYHHPAGSEKRPAGQSLTAGAQTPLAGRR